MKKRGSVHSMSKNTSKHILDYTVEEMESAGAIKILRTGLATSPELRAGLVPTVVMAIFSALARLSIPVLIQQILDRGVLGEQGFRPTFVYFWCSIAVVGLLFLYWIIRATRLRMLAAAENTIYGLRVKVFAHVHRLSLAEHTSTAKGALVTRVTSDIDGLARFTEWGGVGWIVDTSLLIGTIAVMSVYSWQLTLVALVVFLPLLPMLRVLQRLQLMAYDRVRSRVADSSTEISEQVTGAAVVRAYGVQHRGRFRMRGAIGRVYRAEVYANRFFAISFPLGDFFGTLAVATVLSVGALYGPGWGLGFGSMVAFLFLVNLMLAPIAEITEILDDTQIALAGWRKILMVLAMPIEIVEPDPGRTISSGPPDIEVSDLRFTYRTGDEVLKGIDVVIPSGTNVAVVGRTGSGKTTFAKLLVRLADPSAGEIRISGVPLTEISAESRHASIRMVPQDGFLFDVSVAENVMYGRTGSTREDVEQAFTALGLDWWVDRLSSGLDTRAGSRGEGLSVGERQLVALARVQLANPGLLVLDEATSAIDPETERALSEALERLAQGRTTVSIAHRLSTAESADLVLVFNHGLIVEAGSHDELKSAGGIYEGLHAAWIGGTR